jgi:hypothetical protein
MNCFSLEHKFKLKLELYAKFWIIEFQINQVLLYYNRKSQCISECAGINLMFLAPVIDL